MMMYQQEHQEKSYAKENVYNTPLLREVENKAKVCCPGKIQKLLVMAL